MPATSTAAADDAQQQLNVQYRVGSSGAWTNVTNGYFSDVTTGGTATQVTAVDVTLPAAANNQAQVEVRIVTTNAVGSDEWVGIDDIVVSSVPFTGGGDTTAPDAAVLDAGRRCGWHRRVVGHCAQFRRGG